MIASTFPRAAAIERLVSVLVAQLEVERRLVRRHEPVARRRRRRLDGRHEQPAEATKNRGRTPPRGRTAASALEPQHFVGVGRGDPHVLGVDGERGRLGVDRPARLDPTVADPHQFARGEHVDVLARGGDRDRAAARRRSSARSPRRRGRRRRSARRRRRRPTRCRPRARRRPVRRRSAPASRWCRGVRASKTVSVPLRSSTATTRRASAASATGLDPAGSGRAASPPGSTTYTRPSAELAIHTAPPASATSLASAPGCSDANVRGGRSCIGMTAPAAASATQTPDRAECQARRRAAGAQRLADRCRAGRVEHGQRAGPRRGDPDAAVGDDDPRRGAVDVRRPAAPANLRRRRQRQPDRHGERAAPRSTANARRGRTRAGAVSGGVARAAMANAIRRGSNFFQRGPRRVRRIAP